MHCQCRVPPLYCVYSVNLCATCTEYTACVYSVHTGYLVLVVTGKQTVILTDICAEFFIHLLVYSGLYVCTSGPVRLCTAQLHMSVFAGVVCTEYTVPRPLWSWLPWKRNGIYRFGFRSQIQIPVTLCSLSKQLGSKSVTWLSVTWHIVYCVYWFWGTCTQLLPIPRILLLLKLFRVEQTTPKTWRRFQKVVPEKLLILSFGGSVSKSQVKFVF